MRRSITQNNEESLVVANSCAGLLGDTPDRDYSRKLRLFNAFAEPEIRQAIASLGLLPGMRVLDAGCGTGESLRWLQHAVTPTGTVVGIDLSAAHVSAARRYATPGIEVLQCDLLRAPLTSGSFDLIWCANTINHLYDPTRGVKHLADLLRPGGRIVIAQSSLLPDMYFAWDARLERVTNEAVHRYYRDRYNLEERNLASVRAIIGLLRKANLRSITARTIVLERISPVNAATESYLQEAIFRDTWSERLRAYMSPADFTELAHNCDPQHERYALRRPDFHFIQSLSLAAGTI
jgi:ubiquinone/menaquinone biosynthesis C-methylase UbiE